jgi:hypothetical protein
MKKLSSLLIVFVLGTNFINATPITSVVAKTVAENFYKRTTQVIVASSTLVYTETSSAGLPIYYVFDINTKGGFVIVTADDAAHPIIGYSSENHFVQPMAITTIAHWLNKRRDEINQIRANNYQADAAIAQEWFDYQDSEKALSTPPSTMSVTPLVQTTWDQGNNGGFYNDLCPSSSVTGCVATAMAQIMRFWSYPTTGTGSSSYCDCTSNGKAQNYGTLSANYGATTYNWSNMPLNVTSTNVDVATIMFHSGVSVEMDYSPTGSGAYVCSSDNAVSAQNSYVTYFKYDPTTIQGLQRSSYTDAQWQTLLENDLNIGRPIQYAGQDPNSGGHTWVCDGYDASNNFHMNWGWGGYDDGFFAINTLNPSSDNFSDGHEAVIGIQPMSTSVDAGVLAVNSPSGTSCNATLNPTVQIKNFGLTMLTSCVINYHIDNNSVQTQNWSGSLPSGQAINVSLPSMTVTSGTHTLTCSTTNPNSAIDGNTLNDQSVSSFTINSVTAPVTTPASSCSSNTSVTLNASGGGTLNWYTTPTGGTAVNTGATYTTPLLSTTTTYYVESENPGTTGNVGPTTTTVFGAGGYHNNSSTQYLTFEVLQACTLQTAVVNSGAAGTRNIILWDSAGTQLQSVPVSFPNGMGTVTLNIALGPGFYRIGGTGMNLWRNNAGGAYPFTLSGLINITGSSAGPDYYYYIYNWQVEGAPCISPRTPVVATIGGGGPTVTYSDASYDSLLVNASPILLTGGLPAGGTYSGTGVSSSGSFDPSLAGAGVHTITYSFTDINGCSNSATQTIFVSPSTLGINYNDVASGMALYPNPTTGNFSLEIGFLHDEQAKVELMNPLGQTVFVENHNFVSGNNKLDLNMNGAAQGIYFVQVKTSSGVLTQRLVVK